MSARGAPHHGERAGERARLFVAATPPPEVADALADLDRSDERVRWAPPATWHVTLRFLGDAPIAACAGALATIDAPAATAHLGPRVELMFGGVVALAVAGLDDLAAAVLDTTGALVADDGRPFRGHLTLGRVRGRRGARPSLVGTPLSMVFPVDEVVLFRSDRRGGGPVVHTPVASVPLTRR
ncbi:MAG: 2'-5' RNA ligase family protein [Actinomycetota bacterium]|nr:2'-5' RNA ligase family protein [Actinomycetota bacterium]